MNLFNLARYRLTRDPRRNFLQAMGIGIVCALLIVWSTLSGGFSNTIYQMATRLMLGHMQVHHPRFQVSESIYDWMPFSPEQASALHAQDYAYSYRLYQYALSSHGEATKGTRIIGLDPALEKETTDLPEHLHSGHFLVSAKEAVLGYHLAETLKVTIGDEIVVLGTAADGSLASEIFLVAGILKPITAVTDQRSVYIDAAAFRELFTFPRGVHELVLRAKAAGRKYVEPQPQALAPLFPEVRVQSWRQLNPQLAKVLDLLSYTIYITLALVFIALGMLLLNLKLMSTFDRSREYGVMLALGMHPRQVIRLVLWEALWLAVLSGAIALILGLPLAWWTAQHGIDFGFMIEHLAYSTLVLEPVLYGILGWKEVIAPLAFLFFTLPLAAFYPAMIAARIQPTEAIQGKGSGL